ncbi:MAG: D-aminoacyl-tRNA deacylase [Methanolobus sp.]|nr:D-aminoacyl-tRNA deacylase [Methanolobus sp.]
MKEKKTNILCSTVDRASQNIKEHLLMHARWEKLEDIPRDFEGLVSVHENAQQRIIEIKEHHIYQDRIDEKMASCGYDTDLIIVASKHKSMDGRSLLTAHFTGNTKDADFGGRPGELSIPAPKIMCSILRNMESMARDTKYITNMESTHHGPTEIRTPMVYAEIGSSEKQWSDPIAGDIVARAIMNACPREVPVGIGLGGGHYAARQTELILKADVTFGHNFPDHQLPNVDESMLKQAFERSNADFIYFDRKSVSSKERERLSIIIEKLRYPVLRESEIKEMQNIPWDIFIGIKEQCNRLCAEGRFRITEPLRLLIADALRQDPYPELPCLSLCSASRDLLREAINADRKRTAEILIGQALAYIEEKNGNISSYMLCIEEESKTAMQNVTNECIKILKEHYEIKYIPDENILYIVRENFDPKAAKELGVPAGPMLGELARGKPIVVEGRTIEPYMAHKKSIKEIRLSNEI